MATQKIETGLIADSAVTTAKLADNSVTAAKIAAGSLDDQVKGISSSADAVAITIDSSENVGIGTGSPDTLLHLNAVQAGPVLRLSRQDGSVVANDSFGKIEFYTTDVTNTGVAGYIDVQAESGSAYSSMIFGTGLAGSADEKVRISSNGNVGIGTDNPAQPLHVDLNGTSTSKKYLQLDGNGGSGSVIGQTGIGFRPIGAGSNVHASIEGLEDGNGTYKTALTFNINNSNSDTAPVEAMRIDSTASTTFDTGTNDGVKITGAENSTYIDSSKIADVATKGTFIGIKRPEDGTVTVHGIGTYDTSGNTKNNLAITSRSDIVFAGNDGEMGRFLGAGGLTFNGDTAAANALDDYEEGTWTPVLSGSGYSFGTHSGVYVKVGRMVYVTAHLNITTVGTNTSVVNISGYPFTSYTANNNHQVGTVRQSSSNGRFYVNQINVNNTIGAMNSMDGIGSGDNEIFTTGSYSLSMTYMTN